MQFTQGHPVPLQTPEDRIRLFIAFVISLSTLLLIPTPLTVSEVFQGHALGALTQAQKCFAETEK